MSSSANSALWRLTSRKAPTIVRLAGNEKGWPFYCVHSISGDVVSLQRLADELEPGRPIFGFQIPSHRMSDGFGDSVESIAAQYVDLLIAQEPDRPFFLGGWSAGSFIALEMAQILKRRGRPVPLLVALDGFQYGTNAAEGQRRYYWHIIENLPHWFRNRFAETAARPSQTVRKTLRRATARAFSAESSGKRDSNVEKFLDTSVWPAEQAAFVRNLFGIVEKYEAMPYDGPTLVFAARAQHLLRAGQVEVTWRRIAKSAEIIEVEGSHVTMLRDPHVVGLANTLGQRLSEFDNVELYTLRE